MSEKHCKQCRDCIHSGVCYKKTNRKNYKGDLNMSHCEHYISTADITEIKHGKWKTLEDFGEDRVYAKCSNCNEYTDDFDGAYSLDGDFEGYHYYNYCPNCGAKMGW